VVRKAEEEPLFRRLDAVEVRNSRDFVGLLKADGDLPRCWVQPAPNSPLVFRRWWNVNRGCLQRRLSFVGGLALRSLAGGLSGMVCGMLACSSSALVRHHCGPCVTWWGC